MTHVMVFGLGLVCGVGIAWIAAGVLCGALGTLAPEQDEPKAPRGEAPPRVAVTRTWKPRPNRLRGDHGWN